MPESKSSRPLGRKKGASWPVRAGYHHGALREALIAAAKQILQEKGLEGFSLREAARRAGVSAAAPSHHFRSVSGLLSELAADGFEQLVQRLAVGASLTSSQRLRAQGEAYVCFALEHPQLFRLMFRNDLLDDDHHRLKQAGEQAHAELQDAVRSMFGVSAGHPLPEHAQSHVLAAWSIVHGFAHLALDGKLSPAHPTRSPNVALMKALRGMLVTMWPDR